MQPGRRSSTAWGAALGYATIALGIARNILLVPLYLHYVSAQEYGAWLATGGTLVQLLVSDFGVGGVILQRTAAAAGAGDRDRLSVIVGTALASSLVIGALVSAVSIALAPFLPRLLDLDGGLAGRVTDCFLLSIGANAIAVVATVSGNLLRGLQRAVSAGLIQLLAELVVIVVTVVMLYRGYGLYALAWGMVARALVAALASVAMALRVCMGELGLSPRLQAQESRRLTADSSRLFVVSLAMKLLTRSDVFLVGAMLGGSAAAVYGITTRIVDTVSMLVSQLTTALLPGLAHLYGEGNLARFRDLLLRITPVLCALALVGLATAAALDRDFVGLWVGPGLFGGAAVAFCFAAAAFTSAVGFIAYDVLMAAGRFPFIARSFALFAAIQVPLTLLCLRGLGMVGAPVATLLSSLAWCVVLWNRVPAVLAPQSGGFAGPGRAVCVSLLVVAAIVVAGTWMMPPAHTWLQLAASAMAVAAAMLGTILLASDEIRRSARLEALATLRALGGSP